MAGKPREIWRYNSSYGTVIDLSWCMFGLKTDARCDKLLCKFRTTKNLAPDHEMEIGKFACPRDREREKTGPSESRVSNY